MNTTQSLNSNFDRKQEMIDQIMKLHRCADCPIRCQAVKKPHSLFARIHRWHRTWWPGWKIYLRELRSGSAEATART